jgi:hypothetical protein
MLALRLMTSHPPVVRFELIPFTRLQDERARVSRAIATMEMHGIVNAELASEEAIAELAEETHRPKDEVAAVYAEQFAKLKESARITDYLVLFATRRARERLRRARR